MSFESPNRIALFLENCVLGDCIFGTILRLTSPSLKVICAALSYRMLCMHAPLSLSGAPAKHLHSEKYAYGMCLQQLLAVSVFLAEDRDCAELQQQHYRITLLTSQEGVNASAPPNENPPKSLNNTTPELPAPSRRSSSSSRRSSADPLLCGCSRFVRCTIVQCAPERAEKPTNRKTCKLQLPKNANVFVACAFVWRRDNTQTHTDTKEWQKLMQAASTSNTSAASLRGGWFVIKRHAWHGMRTLTLAHARQFGNILPLLRQFACTRTAALALATLTYLTSSQITSTCDKYFRRCGVAKSEKSACVVRAVATAECSCSCRTTRRRRPARLSISVSRKLFTQTKTQRRKDDRTQEIRL